MTTLVVFAGSGTSNTPREPIAGLVEGSDGNFYGTTFGGGTNDWGTVFKMTPGGVLTTLVEFNGINGRFPYAGLVEGSDGNFYGTTFVGGGVSGPGFEIGYGTVFKMTPAGVLTTLVEFSGNGVSNKGALPEAGLIQGSDGNFYGTTSRGGANDLGTVFKMTAGGVLMTLVEFTGDELTNKGALPSSALAQDTDGNFYGTTASGGIGYFAGNPNSGNGTVFKMTPAGVLTTLVEFTGNGASNKGGDPYAALVQGSDGSFYGTTVGGGASNRGTVFKMTPAGALTTLVEFTGNGASNKGRSPAALVQRSDGNFYATTEYGGPNDFGTVFKVTPAGSLTTLLEFTDPFGGGSSKGHPRGALLQGSDGNLYGTTSGGGGSVYRLIFPGPPLIAPVNAVAESTTALLTAKINARGAITAVQIEYGTDGVNFPNTIPVTVNLTGYQTTLLGRTLGDLSLGTSYFYRFRAVSSAGTTVSSVSSFSTLAAPMAVANAISDLAAGVGPNSASARFNGTVNARNYAATAIFEWGTDGNTFPNTAPAVPGTVNGNTPVAVSAAVAGLVKGTPYFYRVRATNAGGVAVSGTQSFTTLTEPLATLGASFALTTTSVRVNGTVRARNSDAQVFFDYGTDGVNFPNSVGATPGLVTGDAVTAVSADLTNLAQGVTYHVRVRAVSAGGTGFSGTGTLQVAVLSGFLQQAPVAVGLEERSGFLFVNLIPSGIGAGWRFVGEQSWRASGVPVGSLTTGDREIEYRPAAGYDQPLRETVSIISGGEATFIEREYYEIAEPGGTGGMIVLLRPEALTLPALSVEQRAQWRLLGEDESAWRESGATLDGLRPGAYLVEAKPLAGRATPPNLSVTVTAGVTATAATTYFLADAVTGTAASLLPFETVTGSPNLPYQYVGQLRSDAGAGSGFVVRARVVATAAHVVFDDATLSAATGQQWLFQRDRVSHEPKPQLPRGAYLFAGYSAQRTAENTPGTSSPASQTLDAAAVYFLEDAGRGSFAGYLASDATPNEWLASSALKTLVGYPITGISASAQGRMHATPLMNAAFTHSFGRTYTTANIRSSGGASGGPLCVQFEGGAYYPAAIFLGGSGQTVVRVIDSDLIEMFNRGEISGNGGDNNGTGGITHTSSPLSGGTAAGASLKVTLGNSSGKWRIGTTGTLQSSNVKLNSLTPGARTLNFTAVAGFLTPPAYSVTLTSGQLTTLTSPITGSPASLRIAPFPRSQTPLSASPSPVRPAATNGGATA